MTASLRGFGLPNECKYLATNLKLTSLFVSDNAFVCGKDCDTKSTKNLRKLILACVYTKTWFGDSLKSCDDLLVFVLTIFQCDMKSFNNSILNQIIFCNVSLSLA